MYNSHYEKILATGEVKCIDDEIPFEIPDSWEWVRYREIANCLLGKTKNPHQQSGTTCPYLCSINVYWDKIKLSEIKEMLFSDTDMKQYSVHKGDMLICEGGEAGRTAIYNGEIEPIYFQNALHRVRFYGNISARFYLHQMEFYKKTGMLNDHIKGETIQHFVLGKLQELIVPLPPLAEQQRIVEKLETLLPLVEQYSDAQIKLEKLNSEINGLLKKSILQEAIQGKLVAQCDTDEPATELLKRIQEEKLNLVKQGKLKKKDVIESTIFRADDNRYYEKKGKVVTEITDDLPFEIPNSWQWCRLSNIANLYTGNSINEAEKNAKYTNVQGTEYIATKDVKFDNSIDYQNGVAIPEQYVTNFRIAPAKSVLMCIEGGSAGRKIGILNQEVCFGNKLCCFAPYIDISEYIFYYLQSPLFFEIFSSNKNGIIGGVSVNNLKELFIPLPPQEEIHRIINKIKAILKSIEG